MTDEPILRLRDEDLAWRDFAGEAVLLDLRTSMYLATNPAATVLWKELARGTTETAMAAALVDSFGIPAERAAADVRSFLADCRERELLA
jgi:hypothetical protein